jgi:adenylate cyclase
MSKRLRYWGTCALIAALSAIVTRALSFTTFFQTLNLKAGDLHFTLRGPKPVSNLFIIRLDNDASDAFPELRIFWNRHYADAIKAAGEGGAKVMGLDLAFIVPVAKWEPDQDQVIAEAASTAPMPVIIGYVPELMKAQDSPARTIPINVLSAATGNFGFTNMTVDLDDFLRNQELVDRIPNKPDDVAERSLAMRIAEVYVGQDATFDNRRLMLGGKQIPISPERTIAINYAGGPQTVPGESIVKFLKTASDARKGNAAAVKQLHDWVEGKIVLLGTDSVDDRFNTPFYTLHENTRDKKWSTAGVEVHANTINTILTGDYILPVPEYVRNLALILATAVAALLSVRFSLWPAMGLIVVQTFLIGLITHLMFLRGHMLSTSETLSASVACLLGSVIFRTLTAENRGALFRKAISLFVSKETAETLEKAEKIELTGKLIEVTILFTDIRGFTAYTDKMCEEEGPEKLVEQLNEYMADMVRIIVKYHGHVNKFIGDGILAVFSDDNPGSTPGDHALRCVQCATEMVTFPCRFSTGSGMHSGPVVVGNIGSSDKMEYTVLGDTVNLASRLESLNKEHHTKLLMSGATEERLGGKIEVAALGTVPVRGKSVPISLYTTKALMPEPEAATTSAH